MKKVIIISVSVLLILLILACSLIGYGDLLPGKPVPYDSITIDATGAMSTVMCNGYIIRANGLGTVVVARQNGDKVGSWSGVYLDKPATHLAMLSLRKGMTLSEVVAVAGMPYWPGGNEGFHSLIYKTSDNCCYELFIGFDGKKTVLSSILVGMPGEKESLNFEGMNSFRWKIRLYNIGIAAVLGVFLVVLLTVPNAIRKKRAKSV